MRGHWAGKVVKVMVIAAAAIALMGFVVMNLWNRILPGLFGWHTITFWQALGLLVLSKILFGGFPRRGGGPGGRWRGRMMERWEKMTPEEREKFRAGMGRRCGSFIPPAPPTAEAKP